MKAGRGFCCMVLAAFLLLPAAFAERSPGIDKREYMLSAREDLVAGEYVSAEEKCRILLEEDPGSFQANLLLGAVIGKIHGREEEALASYEKAMMIDAKHPGIYGEMSSLYGRLGRTEEMIKILEKGLEIFPDEASLNYALGLVYFMKERDPEKAVKYFVAALERHKRDPKLIYITGLSEILRGDIAKALEYITRLREIRSERLASRLEDIIRQRYMAQNVNVGGAVDTYLQEKPEKPPVPHKVSVGEPSGETETTVDIVPGTRTVQGSGTISVKQTYRQSDK
jgi:tetratricopeptide (TPR) repeat protein